VSEKERLVAEIPEDLKRLVDADRRSNKEVVEAALWREFGGQRKAALDRRIEEKERRRSMVESERNERNRELETIDQELEALRAKRDNIDKQEANTRNAKLQKLKQVPDDPSHPLVEQVADELDMEPEQAIQEANNL
jgi:septal ring factor EnvC (AmiA/AmiB activator)